MVFRRKIALRLNITYANGPDPDTDDVVYQVGVRPRQSYHALTNFGTEPDLTWPAGSSSYNMQDGFLFGPNLVSSGGDDYGVRSWSISLEPCRIPGKLQVALYEFGNFDLTSPDVFNEFDITTSAWNTGDLTVHSGTSALYTAPYFRFVPYHLISLLP